MNFNKSKIGIGVMVALLVVAAGPATAALTYDNETTNTTTTSDLVGGETVTNLDNSSHYKYIEVTSDNASSSTLANPEEAFALKMSVNDSDHGENGRTFYTNTSTFTVEDATNGHYSINVSHAEMFDELERDVDETVTVDVTVVFNETESDEEAATIQITAKNGDERAVEVISDDDMNDSDDVSVTNETRYVRDDLDYATAESEQSITNNTTVSLVFANDTVESKYVDAFDAGDFSSGDFIYSMSTYAEGHPIIVYNSESGDAFGDGGIVGGEYDPADDTYAVYHNNGGKHGEHAQLDVEPQGDLADKKSLEVEANGNKEFGFWEANSAFGWAAAKQVAF